MKQLLTLLLLAGMLAAMPLRAQEAEIRSVQGTYALPKEARKGTLNKVYYNEEDKTTSLVYVIKATRKLIRYQIFRFDENLKFMDVKEEEEEIERYRKRFRIRFRLPKWQFKFHKEAKEEFTTQSVDVEMNISRRLVLVRSEQQWRWYPESDRYRLLSNKKLEKVKPRSEESANKFSPYAYAYNRERDELFIIVKESLTSEGKRKMKDEGKDPDSIEHDFLVLVFNKDLDIIKTVRIPVGPQARLLRRQVIPVKGMMKGLTFLPKMPMHVDVGGQKFTSVGNASKVTAILAEYPHMAYYDARAKKFMVAAYDEEGRPRPKVTNNVELEDFGKEENLISAVDESTGDEVEFDLSGGDILMTFSSMEEKEMEVTNAKGKTKMEKVDVYKYIMVRMNNRGEIIERLEGPNSAIGMAQDYEQFEFRKEDYRYDSRPMNLFENDALLNFYLNSLTKIENGKIQWASTVDPSQVQNPRNIPAKLFNNNAVVAFPGVFQKIQGYYFVAGATKGAARAASDRVGVLVTSDGKTQGAYVVKPGSDKEVQKGKAKTVFSDYTDIVPGRSKDAGYWIFTEYDAKDKGTFPRIGKVNLTNGQMTDFRLFGKTYVKKEVSYYLDDKFPMVPAGGDAIFFGQDAKEKTVWLCRVYLD